jgi:hypothetical protein
MLNSGIPDSGLLVHLSEATAGSLNGVGHSTAYEEVATYSYVSSCGCLSILANFLKIVCRRLDRLAVKYLFLTNDGLEEHHPDLVVEPFNALSEQNDYEVRVLSWPAAVF